MGSVDADGELGKLVRGHRLAAGLTQEELAERSGLSVRAISNIERGRTAGPHSRSVRMLAEALGLPDHELAQLRLASQVAQNDQGLRLAAGLHWPWPRPRQLPAAIGNFVGRAAEIAALNALLPQVDGAKGPSGAITSVAITGTAGAGKTALAVHWAHQVRGRFPDGQLYVNLRGIDPASVPLTSVQAIRRFLDALVAPERLPPDPDAQASLYRSLMAGNRMLIILDNALDERQVRPLLPAGPGHLIVVTSRNQMPGLAAVNGARLLALDVRTRPEAVRRLACRGGTEPRTRTGRPRTSQIWRCPRACG